MVDKLEACPFCAGKGHLQFSEFEISEGWHVVCHGKKDCPLYCSEPYRAFDTEAEAIAAWNRRPTPTEDARSRVKVLEEALRPFAKAGELFDREPIDPRYVVVIYGPAAGDDYRITDRHLRAARTALGNKETDRHG